MGISPLTGHIKPRFKMKTIAIVGGTGQTGKWAVKGALLRGYKVKVLARNPDKVTTVLKDLFDESEVEKHQENVTVVKGGISNEEALVELLTGVDTVLSFLGMVGDQSVWVVSPGVENIIAALKKVAENGGNALKLISMSAMGIGDSKNQMKASNFIMGRLTLWLIIPYMLKSCFADLEASEKLIEKEVAAGQLNMMVIRAPVLKSNKNYQHDYTGDTTQNYHIIPATDCDNISSVFIDRQQVAAAFLDSVESRQWDGKIVTAAKK